MIKNTIERAKYFETEVGRLNAKNGDQINCQF